MWHSALQAFLQPRALRPAPLQEALAQGQGGGVRAPVLQQQQLQLQLQLQLLLLHHRLAHWGLIWRS